jgi:molybdopterin synthase catalytic subunit
LHVDIQILTTPIKLDLCYAADVLRTDSGALVEFRGIVRDREEDQAIQSIRYEAYEPMAKKVMRRIIEELARSWPCQAVVVRHRVGSIAVGEAAIYVGVLARHRGEAFSFLSAFMDRLKQDVPIWKVGFTRA